MLCAGLCGLGALALGCRSSRTGKVETDAETGTSPETGEAPSCDPPVPGTTEQGWVEVPLADHPELLEPGGQAAVSVPSALLQVVVAHVTPGCFIAVWRICTHGACEVTWDPESRDLLCPCHGSRFAEDGAVLLGPATEALDAFPVARVGDSLWIHRPL